MKHERFIKQVRVLLLSIQFRTLIHGMNEDIQYKNNLNKNENVINKDARLSQ